MKNKPRGLSIFKKRKINPRINSLKLGNALNQILSCPIKETAISFSGGKDSLVVLDLAYSLGYHDAVFCNTTLEFDETVKYIDIVKRYYPNLNLKIVNSSMNFEEMTYKLGFPSRRYRWCCDVFKFAPLGKYAKENGIGFFITGLRKSESNHRNDYSLLDRNPMMPVAQVNPIIDWSDKDVWTYIWYDRKLPLNPLYNIFDRLGCWCCPYNSNYDWKLLLKHFPDKIKHLNCHLSKIAKIHIKKEHRKYFLSENHWSAWRYIGEHRKSLLMGLCGVQEEKKDFFISLQNDEEVFRVKKLLNIISNDFKIISNKILLKSEVSNEVRLRILVEKATNCVGCGACTLLCDFNALIVKEDSKYGFFLEVDSEKCTHCLNCIKTTNLKSACVVRSYSTNRYAIITE